MISGRALVKATRTLARLWAVVFYVFSGHRRFGDIQQDIMARFAPFDCALIFLSIDVVCGGRYSDLLVHSSVRLWIRLAGQQKVLFVITAHPCETWSVARFMLGRPPPLRTRGRPWGGSRDSLCRNRRS